MSEPDETAGTEEAEEHPRGSLLLLSLYGLLIVALWIWMYVLLIGQG